MVGDTGIFVEVFGSYFLDTAGPDNGIGLARDDIEMKMASTYQGWGDGLWVINEGVDYPRLEWENSTGVLIDNVPVYAGGSGDVNDPYRIETGEHLNSIGSVIDHWDKHFVLVNDINLSEYSGNEYNIIGNYSNRFSGVFDGNGHTISNFTYNSTGIGYVGLFGRIGGAEIKNVGLIDANVVAGGKLWLWCWFACRFRVGQYY